MPATLENARHPASYRDPSGFIFRRHDSVLRQVNAGYQADYEQLMSSGLYEALVEEGKLVPHDEAPLDWAAAPNAYKILRPEQLPLISYPYEWCFSQLRDAALLTLAVQRKAMQFGMSLKDASAYNVQLVGARPMLIDTLSFEKYPEGKPWVAYRQFCQHFLAPLALMSKTDVRLNQLLRVYIDGVPLDLASQLLPWRTKWSISLGLHIHAHAKSQRKHAHAAADSQTASTRAMTFSRRNFEAILASLESAVRGLTANTGWTEWADYYSANNNYTDETLAAKERLISGLLAEIAPRTVWDLGANNGRFSRLAVAAGAETVVAWDIDPNCVEHNYRQVVAGHETALHPLLLDLTNPSPGVGWANIERSSLAERGPVDLVFALGLIHHLAISNNVPLAQVAQFLAGLGKQLILEWVPKEDSQVQKLLSTRADVFPQYTAPHFEKAFGQFFHVQQVLPVPGTRRVLYFFTQKN